MLKMLIPRCFVYVHIKLVKFYIPNLTVRSFDNINRESVILNEHVIVYDVLHRFDKTLPSMHDMGNKLARVLYSTPKLGFFFFNED